MRRIKTRLALTRFSVRMRASDSDKHVSGAETIVTSDGSDAAARDDHADECVTAVSAAANSMIQQALDNQRGDPDEVTVTVEQLSRLSPLC